MQGKDTKFFAVIIFKIKFNFSLVQGQYTATHILQKKLEQDEREMFQDNF